MTGKRFVRWSMVVAAVVLSAVLIVYASFEAFALSNREEIDSLNDQSYAFHYRDLDSTRFYAQRAYRLSANYGDGKAEALNNLAFVCMARMDYNNAYRYLAKASDATDNQVELLVADVQAMRLCQRQSRNKEFYKYRERASRRIKRINEEVNQLSMRQQMRMAYAQSEYGIVESAYFYYVGLETLSIQALARVDPHGIMAKDTAQLLSYYYNVGSGGIITKGTEDEITQVEFDYLTRCYMLARQGNYPYWEANSMQAISEHLQNPETRDKLIAANLPAINYLDIDHMADSLLAGNLAQRSLEIFRQYGDVYQIAGAYRTLAECYWALKDYRSAIICLNDALNTNTVINRAPDLVASIREQLSLAYSAIDEKPKSDYNRNIYLDMQEMTRQDRQLEARASQLDQSARELNVMIAAVVLMIVLVMVLLLWFSRMKKSQGETAPSLFLPLQQWNELYEERIRQNRERQEEVEEEIGVVRLHVSDNRKRNIEQRAKLALVNSITPLIDRIANEVSRLSRSNETAETRQAHLNYIAELAEQINELNNRLTHWIQLRQGKLSLHIESFPLQTLFDILKKGSMGFTMKGVELEVEPTDCVVKADKTLTLFMLNTLVDNARKFTPVGGRVTVSCRPGSDYVEIAILDNGVGMDANRAAHIFDHKTLLDEQNISSSEQSHGFGLMNCKGIIETYRKISQIFGVCTIGVESKLGKGSRFFFRLPKGIVRLLVGCIMLLSSGNMMAAEQHLTRAAEYADSVYNSNIDGNYRQALQYARRCIDELNAFYLSRHMGSQYQMQLYAREQGPAELLWFEDSLPTNYNVILQVRNESAVAALALHEWNLYRYNNKAYTQLFRQRSADRSLGNYVKLMQRSETNKNVAIAMLTLLLLSILVAYYMLYLRHRLYYRFCIDKVHKINEVLLSTAIPEEKLKIVEQLWSGMKYTLAPQYLELNSLVEQVKLSLGRSIDSSLDAENNLEEAEDELHRVTYENARLHVSNSVLDNCLSTLKHETMYYPSRIRRLVQDSGDDVQALRELVDYYKELYTLLSRQAMRQTERNIVIDGSVLKQLVDQLRNLSDCKRMAFSVEPTVGLYGTACFHLPDLFLTEQQCNELFTPFSVNIEYMVCRQIVREIGETMNARGSGIMGVRHADGSTIVKVMLPNTIIEKLKEII